MKTKKAPYSIFPGIYYHIRKDAYEATWKGNYLGTFQSEAKALSALARHLEHLDDLAFYSDDAVMCRMHDIARNECHD